MTHYIPLGAPEVRGVAQTYCGQRVPVKLHDSEPQCPKCSDVVADIDRGMRENGPAVAEDYPEPDEVHPEPDTPMCDCAASGHEGKPKQHGADPHAKNCNVYRQPMEPVSSLATRILGFRQPMKPTPPPAPDPPAAAPQPGPGEFLTTSLETAAATLAVVQQSTDVIQTAEALQVTDGASWLQGIDVFDILRSFEKVISDHYDPHVQRAHAVWNGLTTERRRHLEPIEKARKALGDRCAIWKAAEDRREREEQQRLERLAREEQQLAAARSATQAERAGEPETAKQILEEARTAPLPVVARQSSVPTSSKATTPLRWTCNMLDFKLLREAIGRGEFPEFDAPILEALMPLLNKQATVLKGELGKRYPGTEGRQKPSTAGRG